VPWAQRVLEAGLYTQAAAQFAARSCAAKESAAQPAQVDAAQTVVLALKLEMHLGPAVTQQKQKPEARLARLEPRAAQAESKPPEAQPPAAQPELELRTAAEPPAMLPILVRERCSQIPQVQ
jgi:hypothetical protein